MVYFKKTAMLSEIRPDLRTTQLAELIFDCVHKNVFALEALNEKIPEYRDRRHALLVTGTSSCRCTTLC